MIHVQMGQTISKRELRTKGKILEKTLRKESMAKDDEAFIVAFTLFFLDVPAE